MDRVAKIFEEVGGKFVSSPEIIRAKLSQIKAFVFDWDGVFNNGLKGPGIEGSYSEADSMGTNMLRFSGWLKDETTLPVMAIITGQKNPVALELAQREHFNVVYQEALDKTMALNHMVEKWNLKPGEIAYIFDDILDLPLAEKCGLRFMIQRKASPLFTGYVTHGNYCDYISGREGGDHAVREIAELILGLTGTFEKVIQERILFSETYQAYLEQRNASETENFTLP